jgi:hypothetical protein
MALLPLFWKTLTNVISGYTINSPPLPLHIAGHAGECISTYTSSLITYVAANSASTYTTTSEAVDRPYAITAVHLNDYVYPNPSPTTSSSTISTTAKSTSVTSTAPTNTATSGLSSRAKAGIGVGVSLGAIAFLSVVAAVLLFRRKRRAQATAEVGPEYHEVKVQPVHEMDAPPKKRELHDSTNYSYVPEMMNEGNNIAELSAEMGGGDNVPEAGDDASKTR